MNRTRFSLLALLTLVAVLAAVPAAGAKTKAALPDLVVKKVSKPPKAQTVGTKVKLVVKVANVGDAKAGKSKLGVYLGKGKKHKKKDKRLKRVKVKPLAAGKSKKLKLRVTSTKASVKLVARMKRTKLGSATVDFGREGTRTIALKLSKAGRKALRGRSSAKVSATATAVDAAGQAATSTATRTLR